MKQPAETEIFGPWNPGLQSDIPRHLLSLVTVFREDNVFTTLDEAQELAQYCGLSAQELVRFRPRRLAVHEVLIRVSADLAIYDGRQYEDLGINFRRIAGAVLQDYVLPNFEEACRAFEACHAQAVQLIRTELEATLFPAPVVSRLEPSPATPLWRRWFGGDEPRKDAGPQPSAGPGDLQAILSGWEHRRANSDQPLEVSCLSALQRVVQGIARKHGRMVGDIDLVTRVVANLVSNDRGSWLIGTMITPFFDAAVEGRRFRRLPVQPGPVVMNTKGASASGKSTMRPYQQKLAERIGEEWADFALVSPDIWRKYLLDYASLGPDYKYAGMLCGHEIEIIDRKLDAYMAAKAQAGGTTHLLIDRFRFDSFTPQADEPVRLLTRFGDTVYMFFMVTPPADTVQRAWRRGQIVGRYKAVDDLLAHNIEAFSGMPELFFTWALRTDKRVHYEFLDNTVPLGSRPNTIAFGWNGEMNVLDVAGLINIERYRKVNVRATSPDEIFRGQDLSPQSNLGFLLRCLKTIPAINFADRVSGRIYARMEAGTWVGLDGGGLTRALHDSETRTAITAIGMPDRSALLPLNSWQKKLEQEAAHTIGSWGASALNPMPGSFVR